MLLDEGGSHFPFFITHTLLNQSYPGSITDHGNGVYFAFPALSEKGYLDVRIQVDTPGGHSSIPPKHTVRPFVHNTRNINQLVLSEHWISCAAHHYTGGKPSCPSTIS